MDNYAAIQHSIDILTHLHQGSPMPAILSDYDDDDYQLIREAGARQGVSMRKFVQQVVAESARQILAEPRNTITINCPDCGEVTVFGDVTEGGKPVSGLCPQCGDRLYFG